MIRKTILSAALALAATTCQAALPEAPPAPLEEALMLYETSHWQAAFEAFARLADAGDPEAARIAFLMSRHGRDLYGQSFTVTATQVRRWLAAVAGVMHAAR